MRRMWAASAAVVMCLVLAGSPAATQSPSQTSRAAPAASGDAGSTAVAVHGTVVCTPDKAGSEVYVDGVRERRDWTQSCRYDVDEPRLAGTSDNDFNSNCFAAGCLPFGTERITGPDGDWLGTWRGIISENAGAWISGVFEGTGAYEGWTFAALITLGDEWVVDGLLYQGAPPPILPLPSPASE